MFKLALELLVTSGYSLKCVCERERERERERREKERGRERPNKYIFIVYGKVV
jgi:hypothetical protein